MTVMTELVSRRVDLQPNRRGHSSFIRLMKINLYVVLIDRIDGIPDYDNAYIQQLYQYTGDVKFVPSLPSE